MAIHLVTLVGDYGWKTLRPLLEYYSALGVDSFHVTLHLKSDTDPVQEYVHEIVNQFGCGLYNTISGNFNDIQQEAYVRPRRDYPRDWFILADTDEFQRYPVSLPDLIAECRRNSWEYVRGALVDRVSSDGSFPELDSNRSLEEQFPLGCIVTPVIQKSQPRKVTLVQGATFVMRGQHHAPYGAGCLPEVAFPAVHHFKWSAAAVDGLRRRAQEYRTQGVPHWIVSQNLVDHVEQNAGRLNLELPELLTGPCDPEYSRWEEYKSRLLSDEAVRQAK